MKKSDFDARMPEYLEGELPLDDRALFDAYLDSNQDAAREIAELRQTIHLLRSLPDPEPPPDLADRVMERIRAGEARLAWTDRLREALAELLVPRVWVPVGAVAAAVVVFLVGRGEAPQPDAGAATVVEQTGTPDPTDPRGVVVPSEGRIELADASPQAATEDPAPLAPTPGPATGLAESTMPDLDRLIAHPRPEAPRPPLQQVEVPLFYVSGSGGRPRAETPREPGGPTSGTFQRSGAAPSVAAEEASAEKVARGDEELDRRLEQALSDPVAFTRGLRGYSLAEQELWVERLAARANERKIGDQVVAALEESGSLDAGLLGRSFAAELEQARADVVAEGAQ